jgi:hypothetical protein
MVRPLAVQRLRAEAYTDGTSEEREPTTAARKTA